MRLMEMLRALVGRHDAPPMSDEQRRVVQEQQAIEQRLRVLRVDAGIPERRRTAR